MKILITGHCGFIGSTLWNKLIKEGHNVFGIDNLSRSVSQKINSKNSVFDNITKIDRIPMLNQKFDWIIHLAAQVSVTESIRNPELDFDTNAYGTFKVVEYARNWESNLIYASTNKVFGELKNSSKPIVDSQPLNPSTNYGISKCTGAHYVNDYEKGWVLHQSCIYGGSQIGDIDQGWIGFLRNQIGKSKEITCFGDGTQVRDLLHVQDLLDVYNLIIDGKVPKNQYIVGGGESNAFNFAEVVSLLKGKINKFEDWRPSDQRYFVSANKNLGFTGWSPQVSFSDWVEKPF